MMGKSIQRGMTLIEVIVALLIFSFGLLGLVGLQGRAHTFATSAEDSNRAALLANEIVTSSVVSANLAANLAASLAGKAVPTGSATLTMPSAVDWSARAAAVLPNGAVTFDPLQANNKRMKVTITWRPPTAALTAINKYQTEAILP